jgi:glycerol-3-phosphate acyltransferase PlsY
MWVIPIGYLVGSIPFAFLAGRHLRGIDIRRSGSGNVGAANVLRTGGVPIAVTVMLLDMAKGAAAVLWAQRLGAGDAAPAAAGLAAIVGHIYPVWLRFRGGKGVATAAGVFTVLTPAAVGPAAALFVLTVWLTRYVSLGSILATAALPPLAYGLDAPAPAVTAAAIGGVLIVFRHRSNIRRLRSGTERRLGHRVLP